MTITLENYRYQSSDALDAKLYELLNQPVSETTEDDEELADAIGDELCGRQEEELFVHPDTPSLEDRGLTLGSYAS